MSRYLVCATLFILPLVLFNCADQAEAQAKELFEQAGKYGKEREYDKAVAILQRITINYSATTYSSRAENAIPQYQQLLTIDLENKRRTLEKAFGKIHRALENYKVRFLAYPLTPRDLDKLPELVIPDWNDVWDNPILYTPTYSSPDLPKHMPDGYALASFGKDGLPGGDDVNNRNIDRFFMNGQMVSRVTE